MEESNNVNDDLFQDEVDIDDAAEVAEQDPKAGPVARSVTAVWEMIQSNLSLTM